VRRPLLPALAALAVLSAPGLLLRGQSAKEHPHGDLQLDCGECHGPDGWTPLRKDRTFEHESTGYVLAMAHAKASCRSCHRSLQFDRVGTACVDCHQDAHRGEFGSACESCHSQGTWTNQGEMFRVHSRTRFPLFAVHARLDCTSCHRHQRPAQFAATPAECGNCHLQTFLATTAPSHVQAGFSRRCEDCHSVTAMSWREARFSHPETFPLQGRHGGLTCARCHAAGGYTGLSAACASCHQKDFAAATNPNHVAGRFPGTCQDCHTVTGWRPAKFDHGTTAFPLVGAHGQVTCERCHPGGRYTGTPQQCAACHQADYDRTTNPNHRASGFPTQCENCHNPGAWRPANFDHDRTAFPLDGAHDRVSCQRCHPGGRYAGTSRQCASCHQGNYDRTTSPNHRAAGFPASCESCHDTGAWRPASFDHGKTAFPLTGAHNRTGCERCHTGGRYAGTPKQCSSCHQADYDRTTNPNHRAGNLPTTCESCHHTGAWRPANFDHAKTGFPLTGAHNRTTCERCHPGGRYAGTSRQCASCHQANYDRTTNPDHRAANFPTACETCHGTNAWRPATFDHNRTAFPLTGAHNRTGCDRCHTNGRYAGTPRQCAGCHQGNYDRTTNPSHRAANFPTSCQDCHGTNAWRPATFDHDGREFPIYSGKHRGQWSACGDCHVNPANYKAFECILCHKHADRREMDDKHKGMSGYAYLSTACYRCHPRGTKP
jgi:hypothetical protein